MTQHDYYFTPPLPNSAQRGSILRVREDKYEGDKTRIILSYKSPNKPVAGVEAREEVEVEILGDVQTAVKLLRRIGAKFIVKVVKERTEFTITYRNVRFVVTLDKVKTLGSFVEIELVSSRKGDIQQLIALGEELAAKLHIDKSKKISLGYHEMMLADKSILPDS